MTMTPRLTISLISGLLLLAPAAARAQGGLTPDPGYDEHLAPAPILVALRNEMRDIDERMRVILLRPEYPGLERIAAGIRHDVMVLQDQTREHIEGRHDGPVGGTAEVSWLRQRILELRDAIEDLPPSPPSTRAGKKRRGTPSSEGRRSLTAAPVGVSPGPLP